MAMVVAMVVVVLAVVVVAVAVAVAVVVVVVVAVVAVERVAERGVVQIEENKYFTLPVATLETNRRLC